MNTKVAFTILLAIQIAAGFSLGGDSVNKLLNVIKLNAEDLKVKFVEKIPNDLNNTAEAIKSKVDTLIQGIEQKIKDEAAKSGAVSAAVSACIQAQKDNVTQIGVDAKQAVEGLLAKESVNVVPLIGKMNSTVNEAKSYIANAAQQVTDCAEQSEKVKCFSALWSTVANNMQSITNEIIDEELEAAVLIPNITSDIKNNGESIYQNIVQKSEAIVKEAVQCSKDSVQQ